jgi:uncharacterized protein with HEPN domain
VVDPGRVAIVTKRTRILGPAPGFERVREYVQSHPLPVPPTVRECVARDLLPSEISPGRMLMTPQHTRELIERYPRLYRYADSEPVSSSPPFAREGFACGDGWFGIIDRLSARLVADPNLIVAQAKEKQGVLRFHVDSVGEEAEPDLALEARLYAERMAAREESSVTCEVCGAPGKHEEHRGRWEVRCGSCGWLDDMVLACGFLTKLVAGKMRETFVADLAFVAEAKYHITQHLGVGASHQPEEVRKRFPAIDWVKLDLFATIDSIDKMEQAEGDFTQEELEAMIFRVSPEDLWKFVKEDVPALAEALR